MNEPKTKAKITQILALQGAGFPLRACMSRNLSSGWQAGAEVMSRGSRGVRKGSLAVCEVRSEACSGLVDGLIKALGPLLWPQRSATLADTACHLARVAA